MDNIFAQDVKSFASSGAYRLMSRVYEGFPPHVVSQLPKAALRNKGLLLHCITPFCSCLFDQRAFFAPKL